MKILERFLAVLVCAVAVPWAIGVQAQAYPARPIRFIVPFPPGGPTDVIARIVAQKMTEAWKQQVVVDNRSGAGGNIGMGIAANATADGYTAIFVSSSFMVNPGLYKKIPYDPYVRGLCRRRAGRERVSRASRPAGDRVRGAERPVRCHAQPG